MRSKRLVEGYMISAANYEIVKRTLKERYDKC